VPKESGIKSPADLKGKKIAFNRRIPGDAVIDRFLAAGKLTRKRRRAAQRRCRRQDRHLHGRAVPMGRSRRCRFSWRWVATQRPSNIGQFRRLRPAVSELRSGSRPKDHRSKRADALRVRERGRPGAWTYINRLPTEDGARRSSRRVPQSKLDPASLRSRSNPLKGFAFHAAPGACRSEPWRHRTGRTRSWVLAEGGMVPPPPDSASIIVTTNHRCPHRCRDRRSSR